MLPSYNNNDDATKLIGTKKEKFNVMCGKKQTRINRFNVKMIGPEFNIILRVEITLMHVTIVP